MAANKILRGEQHTIRDENADKTQSKKSVSKHDLDKMYDYVCANLDDPECLQHKVYLNIAFYCGRRGREGLRKLTLNSFALKTTPDGRKYLIMTHNEK